MTEILDLVIPSTFSCRTDIPSGVTPAGACPEEGTCSGEGVRPNCICREVMFYLEVVVAVVISSVVIRLCQQQTVGAVTRAHHEEVRQLEPQSVSKQLCVYHLYRNVFLP